MKILINKLIFILMTLFLVSCSNLQHQDKFDSKLYQTYYDNWEIEKLDFQIKQLENSDINKANLYKTYALERREDKEAMNYFLNNLKLYLKSNNISKLKKNTKNSFINKKILDSIEQIDFSRTNIIYGDTKFYKNTAQNIIGIIIQEQVFYLKVNYELLNREWRIITIKNGNE